ncbi:hypothetical protein GCM10014715_74810 [Streptomyces spiralis]|uniref:Uncharacterized protein n=1 Tax=Streptomyces spiralis TaxID=66376 RepID=A0A919AH07_9ACTN|nr:hypothetical protein [Streptomyces spiralis]GHF07943.1 hypothetical protein GCM10014715_74810 [Streptomyces spiralis]
MTSAEELTAAADLLQPLAEAAQADLETADYWQCYDPATAWRDGFLNGMGGKCSDLVGHFTPAFALELVRLFRSEARRLTIHTHPDWQDVVAPHAVALARAILGGSR